MLGLLTEQPDRSVHISSGVWDLAHMFELSDAPNCEPGRSKAGRRALEYELLRRADGNGLLIEMGQNYADC